MLITARKIFPYTILIFTVFFFCKSGTENEPDDSITVEGTVFIDQVATGNVEVEFLKSGAYYSEWYTSTQLTDNNGKYCFIEKPTHIGATFIKIRIRIRNPLDGEWTDYRQRTVPLGGVITENFNLYSAYN